MESRRCAACGQGFVPRPQVPHQTYCPAKACQRERRRLWQQAKREGDPDYHDNQIRAQQAWCKQHPEYWAEYRRTHAQYEERNRTQQRTRNARRRRGVIAKMDVCKPDSPVASGTYRLTPVVTGGIAKMDAWTVEIAVLSKHYDPQADDCKERT
ncbi:MAG: hypothetical protein OEW16_08175 [Gammaproteobacteria bacterium]|nr:hypothetical protein [Gammaproteobacteria bacterium]